LIFLVLFATYAIILLTRKSKEYRKFVVESKIIHDRQFVKMIMNKFEILQNYRVNREVKILNDNYEDIIN
jgi:hypothetical protein